MFQIVQKYDKKNAFLPYADDLEEESYEQLKNIKTYFGLSILFREPRESLLVCTETLSWYISLYGLKFTKEDHVLFIEILYQYVTVHDAPLSIIPDFVPPLVELLRKKKFLVPGEDLTLPWRPLYDICKKVFFSGFIKQIVSCMNQELKSNLENLVHHARFYFAVDSTKEILEELKPMLCPFDNKAIKFGIHMLSMFLPISSSNELADITYKCWLEEIMQLWDACSNNAFAWEDHVLHLMSTLANLNIGNIDWESYIPSMYSRFLRHFKLPVFYKKTASMKASKISEGLIASWIVSTLGGGSKSQDYLDQLLKTLESYCHPANSGYWSIIIKSFLKKLSKSFLSRVKKERFGKPSWFVKIPQNKKLNDEDIYRFVISMQSVCTQAMFSLSLGVNFPSIFQELATLRPDIIVPPLIEKLYLTIDCLTEPHKLLTSLQNVCCIARPMMNDNFKYSFKEGRRHIIPLLFAVLPGIDPNDHRKSLITLHFISTFVNLIPVVDCSSICSHYSNLTSEEEEAADATSQFEEFILQYMDRIFLFIENMAQENVRIENSLREERSKIEKSVHDMMQFSCFSVFGQLSRPLFMIALKKTYDYAMYKILEREVAGVAIAVMIRAFAEVNAEETFKLFIPKLSAFILDTSKNSNIINEERLDNELLYKMLLLSELVGGNANMLIQYLPTLLEVLDATLHLKCKEGYEISAQLLCHILTVLSNIYPINLRTHFYSYDGEKIPEKFPLKEWGKSQNLSNLNIQWYVPSVTEIDLIEKIFWKYLIPELDIIDKYINNEIDLDREHLRRTLTILLSLFACCNLIESWNEEPPLKLYESQVPFLNIKMSFGIKRSIRMPDNSNVYKIMIEKMSRLQFKLLKETDDTVSFLLLTKIWSNLFYMDMFLKSDYDKRRDFLKMLKENYENKLIPSERNVRYILIEEISLKHLQRMLTVRNTMTPTHREALSNLFELATCDYKSIQRKAQNILFEILSFIYSSNYIFTEEVVKNLSLDTSKYSEKFKGTLNLLKGIRKKGWHLCLQSSYGSLKHLLPAVVNSMPSEEPSVIKLLNEFKDYITNSVWHFPINVQIPDDILKTAEKFWADPHMKLLCDLPSEEQVKNGFIRLQNENNRILNDYQELTQALLDVIKNKNLQWRYELMGTAFLGTLLISEVPCSIDIVRYFLSALINDSIAIRKIALKSVVCIMKLSKPKTIREKVDPFMIQKNRSASSVCLNPGPRDDNFWCRYHKDNIPKNASEWDEIRYSYKCYLGYYGWPKELYLYTSSSSQPINHFDIDQLSPVEKEIDLFFTNESNINKLIEYYSLEENKNDPLRCFQIALFKYVFKIHEDRYLEIFKPHVEKLLESTQDSSQRAAAEIFAGILKGMKLWTYEKTKNLYEWCLPLLRKTLDNMTVETQKFWGSSMATSFLPCDVNRSGPLLELLMEKPIKGDAAYKDCGRLYAAQSCGLHSWRLCELWNQLLEYLKPHLANPYQNLRERLGSVLVTIFEVDIEETNWNRVHSPRVSEFLNYLLPKLEILYNIIPNSKNFSVNNCYNLNSYDDEIDLDEDEINEAILLLKTASTFCSYLTQRAVYPMKADFWKLFPLLCFMENYDKDDELKKICKNTLSVMSVSFILQRDIPIFVEASEKVICSNSWCAKCTCLDFLQVFALHNLFTLSSSEKWIVKIFDIIKALLEDDRCEVRQKAGEVISGFIHYNIVKNSQELIDIFCKMSRISLNKKRNINIRHAGVIGLCSFINAYPYTVPAEIPKIFLEIRDHLNDPEPIPSTIRKTLGNFNRTHYSDWNELKLKFTADELEIFSDIIVPPNHYA